MWLRAGTIFCISLINRSVIAAFLYSLKILRFFATADKNFSFVEEDCNQDITIINGN